MTENQPFVTAFLERNDTVIFRQRRSWEISSGIAAGVSSERQIN
jgi:hypothetical protein